MRTFNCTAVEALGDERAQRTAVLESLQGIQARYASAVEAAGFWGGLLRCAAMRCAVHTHAKIDRGGLQSMGPPMLPLESGRAASGSMRALNQLSACAGLHAPRDLPALHAMELCCVLRPRRWQTLPAPLFPPPPAATSELLDAPHALGAAALGASALENGAATRSEEGRGEKEAGEEGGPPTWEELQASFGW